MPLKTQLCSMLYFSALVVEEPPAGSGMLAGIAAQHLHQIVTEAGRRRGNYLASGISKVCSLLCTITPAFSIQFVIRPPAGLVGPSLSYEL